MNIDKLDKKALREKCDELGIEWDKRQDDEDTLRSKIKKALKRVKIVDEEGDEDDGEEKLSAERKKKIREALEREADEESDSDDDDGEEEAEDKGPDKSAVPEWDLTKRAPIEERVDKQTGKMRKVPLDCFGWLFDKEDSNCKLCPHAKTCERLSKDAAEMLVKIEKGEKVAGVEFVGEGGKKLKEKKGKASKAEKVVEAKKEQAKAEAEDKPEKLSEDTLVKVRFDSNYVKKVVDKELIEFYRALLTLSKTKPKMKVKRVIDTFADHFEVENRKEVLNDLVVVMIENKELKRLT